MINKCALDVVAFVLKTSSKPLKRPISLVLDVEVTIYLKRNKSKHIMNRIPITNYALSVINQIQTIRHNAIYAYRRRKRTANDVSTIELLISVVKTRVIKLLNRYVRLIELDYPVNGAKTHCNNRNR